MLKIGGKEYQVTQTMIGDILAYREYSRNKKLQEIIEVCKNVEGIDKTALIAKHLSEKPDMADLLSEALVSFDGIVFLLHKSIARIDASITRDMVRNSLPVSMNELKPVIEMMTGVHTKNPTPAPAAPVLEVETGKAEE